MYFYLHYFVRRKKSYVCISLYDVIFVTHIICRSVVHVVPNNVTYYTSTSSGCACSDTDSTTQCACCVGGVSGCSCHSNVDSTICVLCSSDADQFLEWCQQPFVYYPPTVGAFRVSAALCVCLFNICLRLCKRSDGYIHFPVVSIKYFVDACSAQQILCLQLNIAKTCCYIHLY